MNEFDNKDVGFQELYDSGNGNVSEEAVRPADAEENTVNITEEQGETKPKRRLVEYIYDYVETFSYALALMMVLLLFVFRMVSVDGSSMETTLHNEDSLIISNLFYTPKTGDIVVINPEVNDSDDEPIIKRVIATEGQTVFIDYDNWAVYVDGVKLDEPYIQGAHDMAGDVPMNGSNVEKYNKEFVVDEGHVFVMGDNRNNSLDSRNSRYREINENRILGRVIIRLSPNFGFVD